MRSYAIEVDVIAEGTLLYGPRAIAPNQELLMNAEMISDRALRLTVTEQCTLSIIDTESGEVQTRKYL